MDVAARFGQVFDRAPTHLLFSPGRVNLIGEHIDYCGGQVMPMAIDRGTQGAFSANDRGRVRVFSSRFDELAEFDLGSLPAPQEKFVDYAVGVASCLTPPVGFDLCVTDNISAGGLSSSASFSLAVAGAFQTVAGIGWEGEADRLVLARKCQQAENEFVGVPCGIMDQASVALGGVILLDCATLAFERVETTFGDYRIVVMDTRQPRTLAASAYAERVAEIGTICTALGQPYTPARLCVDVTIEQLPDALGRIPAALAPRLNHVVQEQARVVQAAQALGSGDLQGFGSLMTQSHGSLRDNFAVTGPALDLIVELSLAQPGVLGARMTGAGFGGCAIALVHRDALDAHNGVVVAGYESVTGTAPMLFEVSASPGTHLL